MLAYLISYSAHMKDISLTFLVVFLLFHFHFNSKQRGPEAIKAHNVFYHMTYYDDDSPVLDEKRKNEVELHMAGFGRCPTQLFDRPHKPKVLIHNRKIKNFF